jgi:hypothetical protein
MLASKPDIRPYRHATTCLSFSLDIVASEALLCYRHPAGRSLSVATRLPGKITERFYSRVRLGSDALTGRV